MKILNDKLFLKQNEYPYFKSLNLNPTAIIIILQAFQSPLFMSIVITSEPINDYVGLYSDPESEVLRALSLETRAVVPGAQMLTGHLAGTFLEMISKMLQPKVILELGTYTGYSAICLAKGLSEDGRLITIDKDERWNALRKEYWTRAGLQDKIEFIAGDAVSVLASLEVQPDLVFIDADKKNYWHYFDTVVEKMKQGGVILVDNVLFHGEVILPEDLQPSTAANIHQFNIRLAADNRVEKVLLPIRDGITLIIKK